MSQKDDVLLYIQDYGGITRKEAINIVGVGNLPNVISELRKDGHNIQNEWLENKTDKKKNRYVKYFLSFDLPKLKT